MSRLGKTAHMFSVVHPHNWISRNTSFDCQELCAFVILERSPMVTQKLTANAYLHLVEFRFPTWRMQCTDCVSVIGLYYPVLWLLWKNIPIWRSIRATQVWTWLVNNADNSTILGCDNTIFTDMSSNLRLFQTILFSYATQCILL